MACPHQRVVQNAMKSLWLEIPVSQINSNSMSDFDANTGTDLPCKRSIVHKIIACMNVEQACSGHDIGRNAALCIEVVISITHNGQERHISPLWVEIGILVRLVPNTKL